MAPDLFTPLGDDHIVLRVRDQAYHVNERISLIHLRFGDQLIDLVLGKVADELKPR